MDRICPQSFYEYVSPDDEPCLPILCVNQSPSPTLLQPLLRSVCLLQSKWISEHSHCVSSPLTTHCTPYIPKASSHKYAGRYPFIVRRQTDQPEHHHRQSNEAIRSQAATIKLCRAVNPDSHKIASSSSRPLPSLHCRFIPSHKILQWPTGRGVQQTSYRQPE